MSAKLLKLSCINNLNDGQHWSNVEDHSSIVNLKISSFYSNPNFRYISNEHLKTLKNKIIIDVYFVEFSTETLNSLM